MTHPVSELPVAGLDRRFYAFVLDGLLASAWIVLVGWSAYQLFWRDDRLWTGLAMVAGGVVALWLGLAVALGIGGATPGKAATGLRAVHSVTGTPIGVSHALLRGLVLAAATVSTFGIGLATLAWTAVTDPDRRRRGWHDQVAGSVVVDVRPVPAVAVGADSAPRHVVNLTAMRLVPPAPAPAPQTPRRPLHRSPTTPAAPPASHTRWVVSFDTGQEVPVGGPVLVGRRPEARPGEAVQHLVALPSPDMSLSRTHAHIGIAGDGALVVTDRDSTNGSTLTRQGVSRPLSGGRPTTLLDGDLVRFGDRSMQVSRLA
jgi:hypothetical protein